MKLELQYLELLENIEDLGCGSLYGLENMRVELHHKLLEKHGLSDYYIRSKAVMGRLDVAIDLSFPLERGDHLKPYARELERLLSCQEAQYFISGKGCILRTKYGVITDS